MTESPRLRLALLAAIPLAVVSLVALISATREGILPPGSIVEVSGRMPMVQGATLQGNTLGPADYRGDVVVVNFWASWCGPCRREQPGLQRLHEEYGGRGVTFLGIDFKDDPAAARTYLTEFGVTYPSVADQDGRLAHLFGIPYLPATIVVDAEGRMRYLMVGAQPEQAVREHVDRLLAEDPEN
jgi:cytochrome c biogenesis protein CcmG, thiol:disulfide interchange protein DsbE